MKKEPIVLLFLSIIFISPFTSAIYLQEQMKGKFDNQHYELLIFNETIDWYTSENKCINRGGRLVEIFSQEENSFITSLLLDADWGDYFYQGAWIGLTDEVDEDTWLWNSGQNTSMFENFGIATGEPNNGITANCAAIETARVGNSDGWWNDSYCDDTVQPNFYRALVCEYDSWIPPTNNCLAARDYQKNALAHLIWCKTNPDCDPNSSGIRERFHSCVAVLKLICPHGSINEIKPVMWDVCAGIILPDIKP